MQTARDILEKYYWYIIPTALHIILIHGADIINNSIIPIGKMAEESIETSHKVSRRYREHHARTIDRVKQMKMFLIGH